MSATTGNVTILGLQFGDEGKGKSTDRRAAGRQAVIRAGGGDNAGHTVQVGEETYKLHLIPSAVAHPTIICGLGQGMVINPSTLMAEVIGLAERGIAVRERLLIDPRAHLITPYHIALDVSREDAGAGVGSTRKGIGPAYTDKAGRTGVRVGDILRPGFEETFRERYWDRCRNLEHNGHGASLDLAARDQFLAACRWLAPRICDLQVWLRANTLASFVFEGAQGAWLDLDGGTYPYVTSSNTGVGGILNGVGINHKQLGQVIGVAKAYTTRVGQGPFVTKFTGSRADRIRQRGNEYGTTTGRPRDIGALDLVALRQAVERNGVDAIDLTKLDVLTGEPELLVCTEYRWDGRRISFVPADARAYVQAEPVYRKLSGWDTPISPCRTVGDLPKAARRLISLVEDACGVPVATIGVGPGREETIENDIITVRI